MSYPGSGGNGTIISRGWLDPENRDSISVSEPVTPGTFYTLHFDMQPKDMVIDAGRRIGVMILSSDYEHTIRPAPGTQLSVDLSQSTVSLPIVGGQTLVDASLGTDTTTSVAADYNPTAYGHPVTFTATVSASGAPTGTVQFNLDGAPVGVPVAIDAAGRASWTTSSLGIGTHSISADYAGDGFFAASSSAPLDQVVKKRLATATAVTSDLNPSLRTHPVTFTATVTPENPSSGITPAGFIQWKVDGVAVGVPTALDAMAQATMTTADLALGNRGIRAVYLGSPAYTGSTSPTYVQGVHKPMPTGTVVAAPASPIAYGTQPITLTATFSNPIAPVGSLTPADVRFLIDGTSLGAPVALQPDGSALFTVTWNLPAGSHVIRARYLGNAEFAPGNTAPLTLVINP